MELDGAIHGKDDATDPIIQIFIIVFYFIVE
jgi:hypothetical protein